MSREFKQLPLFNIKAESDGRTRAGIAAVFGNIDDGNDITHKGAFTKTLNEGRKRFKHLWNHDSWKPPIASILDVKEVGRDGLPAEVLEFAPEATGGLYVKRDYYKTEFADWVLEAIDRGDVDEMSYAYDVVKWDYEEIDGKQVRNLRELVLFDTSDVNYGMNSATFGNGMKSGQPVPLGLIYSNLLQIENQIKSGGTNSDADQKLLDLIHETACGLGAKCTESPLVEPEENEETEEAEAGAVKSTPLPELNDRFQTLRINSLKN